MSRFQKNALLTLIFLATIAYPPLYYSIKNTIEKEALPKSYNAPSMIPKISLRPWNLQKVEGIEVHEKAIRNLTSLEFEKMSNLVFSRYNPKDGEEGFGSVDIELGGNLDLDRYGIIFKAEVSFPKFHKSYNADKIRISWEEIGKAPTLIAKVYVDLVKERIRLNRFLLLAPEYKQLSDDLNPEILSNSEYSIYKTVFEQTTSDQEKLSKLTSLISLKPNAIFLAYEYSRLTLKMNGMSANKDVIKNWKDKRFVTNPFTYLLLNEIGNSYFNGSDFDLAYEFLQASRKEREDQGKVYHLDYANSLSKLGRILVTKEKYEEALFYFTAAKEMYETLCIEESKFYKTNQIHYSLLLAILGQREVALNEFYKLEKSVSDFTGFEKALFYFNFARLQYSLSAFESSLHYVNLSRSFLFKEGLANHELNFHCILLSGTLQFHLKQYNLAQSSFEEIINAKLFLPIEDKPFFRNALLNMAYIYQVKGSTEEAENYYRQYTRVTPYNLILPFDLHPSPQISPYIQIGYYETPPSDEFTNFEETVIRSYTGRYIFNGQDEEIRARTYQDRLEDTNEFLRDLIQVDFFGTPALSFLKDTLFPPVQNYAKGENMIFIDIGPALNNLEAPGITSQSVAYHFPKMNVILWELPTEVDLFLKKVPADKKDSLYAFTNIRIIGADGVGNFLESYQDSERWLFRNRSIPKLEDKTIIIRAANSIDIYETFAKIQPHFKDLGKSLMNNPVLYFFNRSILLKPKGSAKFTLIGYQSVRGFHHNFQSLDRNGEPPYTLAKYTLSDK